MGKVIEYKITPNNSLYFYDKDGDRFAAEIFIPYDEDEDDGMLTVCCGFAEEVTHVRTDFTIYELFEACKWVYKIRNEGK